MPLDGIHPQSPRVLQTWNNSVGQHLLGLVKSFEKGNAQCHLELCGLLDTLSQIFLRKGLLEDDAVKAEKILTSGGKTSSQHSRRDTGEVVHNQDKDDLAVNNTSAYHSTDDTNLLLTALVRLVGGNHELSSPRIGINLMLKSHSDVVLGGFQVCHAILQHLLSLRKRRNSLVLAELHLILGVSRSLLTGISRTLDAVLGVLEHKGPARQLIGSCFRVATLIIAVGGVKLSRAQVVLSSLRSLAWKTLSLPEACLREAAGTFLAALPLAGIDKLTPSELWTNSSVDNIAALFLLLNAAAPIKTKSFNALDSDKANRYLSKPMRDFLGASREKLAQETLEDQRLRLFNALSSGLTQCIISLLDFECYVTYDGSSFTSARFPVLELLDLVECMLAFHSSAENLYHGTKKRLRMEMIEGGLLSAAAVVESVANLTKQNALTLLIKMMQALGRPTLLPYGKRVIKLAFSSLQTSCSLALQYAVDPMHSVRLDGKRKKWLHTSVVIRTQAIETFRIMMCTIGSNALLSTSSSSTGIKRMQASPAEKSVMLIVGCLLEQISTHTDSDSWGSVEELVTLLSTVVTTISSILIEGSGFLSHSTRSLIDSSIQNCLTIYLKRTCDLVFSSSKLKIEILRLVQTSIFTPWPDGASTFVVDGVRKAITILASDVDVNVASQARSCLQLLHFINTTRSPPLYIATRGSNDSQYNNQEVHTKSIMERLEVARDTIAANKSAREASTGETKRKEKHSPENAPKRTKLEEPEIEVISDPVVPCDIAKEQQSDKVRGEPSSLSMGVEVSNVSHHAAIPVVLDGDHEDELDEMIPGIIDAGPDDDDDDD